MRETISICVSEDFLRQIDAERERHRFGAVVPSRSAMIRELAELGRHQRERERQRAKETGR